MSPSTGEAQVSATGVPEARSPEKYTPVNHAPSASRIVKPGPEVDARLMAAALALGRRTMGAAFPNPAVGCLVVQFCESGPVIVGRGVTAIGGRPHAERIALRQAGGAARGATVYVTLEPCAHHGRTPPCSDALIASGVARVVSAIEDPDPRVAGKGHAALRAAGIDVTVGVRAAEARRDHAGHIRRIRDARPEVTLKLALSADGFIGRAGEGQVAITGPMARRAVQIMRMEHDAILVGAGTARADDPRLTVRLDGLEGRSPVRVVLDARGELAVTSALVSTAVDHPLWFYVGEACADRARETLTLPGVTIVPLALDQAGRFDVATVLADLARRGITSLLVEGGAAVAAAFAASDLIDEAVLFHAPIRIGEGGLPPFGGCAAATVLEEHGLVRTGCASVGDDRMERFERPWWRDGSLG